MKKTLGILDKYPKSIWLLTSTRDKAKFLVNNIDTYVPKGKGPDQKVKFKTHSGEVDSLVLYKHQTRLDTSLENDRHNLNVLINHYDVKLLDEPQDSWDRMVQNGDKVQNPQWTLKSMDLEDLESFDEDVSLIGLRYWLTNKENPVSLKKAIYLSSLLGLPYSKVLGDYAGKPEMIRAKIISSIDKKIMKEDSARKLVENFKDDLDKIERMFFIEEFIKNKYIIYESGIYRFGTTPLGIDKESINMFFDRDLELYESLKQKFFDSQKDVTFEEVLKE